MDANELRDAGPTEIFIFGATGDLAMRKLLPSLYFLFLDNRLPKHTRVVAVSRRDLGDEAYRALADERARPQVREIGVSDAGWSEFLAQVAYCRVDVGAQSDYAGLAQIANPDAAIRMFYLATHPELYTAVAGFLGQAGLVDGRARLVMEKPLGHDLASARAINRAVAEHFAEEQVFRIDHYLGKETVQNLMALRFGNSILEPLWRAPHIDHVEISVTETLGVTERGDYYDSTGALRDMVQNHMLQLLCLTAMEPPVRFEQHSVRNEKLKVLQSLRTLGGAAVRGKTVRGQYTASVVGGQEIPAYYFEEGVAAESNTETYVALKVEVDNWRWSGTPFYLRTGKRMAMRESEIVVYFKPVAHEIFPPESGAQRPNMLIIRLQPEEGIELVVNTKIPGKGMSLRAVPLDLNLADAFKRRRWGAYERLLLDVLRGDSTLFMRADEIEAAWAWIDPIIEGWRQHYPQPSLYKAGTMGPEKSTELLREDGFCWREQLDAGSG